MDTRSSLLERSEALIEGARFMTLATTGSAGVWASTVNFVPLREPLRFLWYSLCDARHSRNIARAAEVAGSIYRTDLDTDLGLDGAQFTGVAQAVEPDGAESLYDFFYERNFPGGVPSGWQLPMADFRPAGPRSFYAVTVTAWWLVDLDHWLDTKNDRRVEVDLTDLRAR